MMNLINLILYTIQRLLQSSQSLERSCVGDNPSMIQHPRGQRIISLVASSSGSNKRFVLLLTIAESTFRGWSQPWL
ncbi:hypothetical protein EON65_30640 [archaeon]|nr:MAG: hypothetical protein EON65_30640 [archaeon]